MQMFFSSLRCTKNVSIKPVPTIGVEFAARCFKLKNEEKIIKAQLWDTCILTNFNKTSIKML